MLQSASETVHDNAVATHGDRAQFEQGVRLRPTAPARHHLLMLRLISTLGGSTVAAYFRSQSPLEYEFATDRIAYEWNATATVIVCKTAR